MSLPRQVTVPQEARDALEAYIDGARGREPGPLFVAPRERTRLTTRAVACICERLAVQACAHVKDASENFTLTPHMLRHTFLKLVADKHGVHVTQQMSGNVNFRYTKPSDDEVQVTAEGLFQ